MPENTKTSHPITFPTVDYSYRQTRLQNSIQSLGFNGLVLNPGPSLTYLTGLDFHLMERPTVAIFIPEQPLVMIIPQLEKEKLVGLSFQVNIFQFSDDPAEWPAVFSQAAQVTGLSGKIGVEPTRLRFLELEMLRKATSHCNFLSAEELLADLRLRKEPDEIAKMQKAVDIAQQAFLNTLPFIKPGLTERQIAAELTIQLLRAGSDTTLPFSPIVASGPNSANPHATPTDRSLTPGDLLVIDWGAFYEGYCSDLTRALAIDYAEDEYIKISEIVAQANQAGRSVARPGIPAGQVDVAARRIIDQAGYGPYFTHRTGHGLGMEGHEAPYMRSGNPQILEPGMSFTVEPGIYLPGRGGVRIEDDVVITEQSALTLSTLPRQLKIIRS